MRQINVFINQTGIGTLFEDNDIWSFQYHSQWLNAPDNYAISPYIPLSADKQTDGSTHRHIQWFFDNLLPEEGARNLLAHDIKVDSADAFGILAVVGAESAGALTLTAGQASSNNGTIELTPHDLNDRINALPDIPLNNKDSKRMSIAGAQHKMLLIKHNEQFFEPVGYMPSSHILKPEHTKPQYYWQTVRNEWFVMQLAGELGLNVATTEVHYLPAPVYIIKRFDRQNEYPNQTRVHTLDGCQLLGLSRSTKYQQSNVTQLNRISEMVRNKGAAKLIIFNWAVFNALVGNTDAHLKNLSCLVTPGGYTLSPLYDLLSTAIYEDGEGDKHLQTELSQPMGTANYLGDLRRKDVLVFGQALGLPQAILQRQLDNMTSTIIKKADALIAQVEALPGITNKAGELRMLREIRYKMIAEMVNRLKG